MAPIFRTWLVLGVALLAVLPAASSTPRARPAIDEALLRPGDLLFRVGDSLHSAAVLSAQGNGWSHVGIVVSGGAGALEIIHASPADEPSEFNGVRRVSLLEFARHANSLGAYRPKSPAAASYAAAHADQYLGRPFDSRLDSDSDAELYCTELITAAFRGSDLPLEPARTRYTFPMLGVVSVIEPNALAAMPMLSRIL